MTDFNELMFNPDGSFKDGTVTQRPMLTPYEAGLSPEEKARLIPSAQVSRKGYGYRMWDRVAFQNAKPGDNFAQTMWGEVSEAATSFASGLRRARFNYAQAAQYSADWVADKIGLDFDLKKDFLAASLNKWKNMRIEPTTQEWEDQLFYLLGNLAPDAVMIAMGGGVLGAAVSSGARAANVSVRAANIASTVGRIAGDTSLNVLTFMAHEAGQAELDGREADYAQAGKEALVIGATMSTVARASQLMGLKRRYSAALTGGVLGGITALQYPDDDPNKEDAIAANTILGGLFGAILPGVGGKRVGAGDIYKWVKARRSLDLDVTVESYLKEFRPLEHEKMYVDGVLRDDKVFDGRWGEPEHMSPKDDFLMFLSQATEKDVFGHADNQLVHLLAELQSDPKLALGEYKMFTGREFEIRSGMDHPAAIQNSKVIMDSVNATNAQFLKDHPTYKSIIEQPNVPPTYTERTGLKQLKESSKMFKEGFVAKETVGDATTNFKPHQLSLKEYLDLFGNTEANKAQHRQFISEAANTYKWESKKSWPNKGGLIQHGMYDTHGHLYRRIGKGFLRRAEQIPALKIAENWLSQTKENTKDYYQGIDNILNDSLDPTGFLYKQFVDPAGRLYNALEGRKEWLPIRNALQLHFLKDSKYHEAIDAINREVGFDDMSIDYKDLLSTYINRRAELDAVKRRGHEPVGDKPLILRSPGDDLTKYPEALRILRDKMDDFPGGKAGFDRKVDIIESKFAELFERGYEAGLFSKATYDILKAYKYVPQKTLEKALSEHHSFLLGQEWRSAKSKSVVDNYLKDMLEDGRILGKQTDIERLLQENIVRTERFISENSVWNEMAKVGDTEFWKFEKPPRAYGTGKIPMDFVQRTFMKDGTQRNLWVEKKTALMLDSVGIKAGELPATARWVRLLSGTSIVQTTAVAANPFFAIFTHPLDLWHVITHHQSLPKFVPTAVKDFYVHNAERGAVPFMQNFMSAWKKDKYFQDYVNNDGTVMTMISHVTRQEMIDKSGNYLGKTGVFKSASQTYDKFLKAVGKFGHTMEVATRMTETGMLQNTKNPVTGANFTAKEAAHEALRRLNYSRRGEFMQIVDTFVPFANAQAQILASQLSEIKTPKGALRVAAVTGQLVTAMAITRAIIEEHFPGFVQDIPFEQRMRYWHFPTGAQEADHVSQEIKEYYFKVKMAYNPIFTLLNAVAQLEMDRFYYGEKGMPPQSYFASLFDAVKVSMPVELQQSIPPALKVFQAYTGNTDMEGNKVYKGAKVEAYDEVNDERSHGVPTHNYSIALGKLTGTSPARLQKAVDSLIAENPLSWFVGTWVGYPKETQTSMLTDAIKFTGIRKFVGTTNKKWREYQSGDLSQKKAGSNVLHEYWDQIAGPLAKFHARQISVNDFKTQVRGIIEDAKPVYKMKAADLLRKEIKSRAYMDRLLKRFPLGEVYENMQIPAFWYILSSTQDPEYRAQYFFDRLVDLDSKDWQERLVSMAKVKGLFEDRFFAKEYRKLKNSWREYNEYND